MASPERVARVAVTATESGYAPAVVTARGGYATMAPHQRGGFGGTMSQSGVQSA